MIFHLDEKYWVIMRKSIEMAKEFVEHGATFKKVIEGLMDEINHNFSPFCHKKNKKIKEEEIKRVDV